MVREGEEWKQVDWETALKKVADGLREQASSLGILANASSTTEELFLLKKLAKALGTSNIDHRVRQRDVRDQAADPLHPSLGRAASPSVESLDSLLLVGCNIRREAPMLAHRVRKAARRGAKVSFLNPAKFDYLFPVAAYFEASGGSMVADLAAVLSAVGGEVPAHLTAERAGCQPDGRASRARGAAQERQHQKCASFSVRSLRDTPRMLTFVRWLRPSRRRRALRSACSPKVRTPRVLISPARFLIVTRAARTCAKVGLSAQEMLREKLGAYRALRRRRAVGRCARQRSAHVHSARRSSSWRSRRSRASSSATSRT